MPMDRKKYPKDWPEISRRIRMERAKSCCEWCGVPNYAYRDRQSLKWVTAADFIRWRDGDPEPFDLMAATLVVLTVAHLGVDKPDGTPGDKRDTMDCREENLAALCQRCHLNFDRQQHLQNRMHNRRRSLVEAGQLEMF